MYKRQYIYCQGVCLNTSARLPIHGWQRNSSGARCSVGQAPGTCVARLCQPQGLAHRYRTRDLAYRYGVPSHGSPPVGSEPHSSRGASLRQCRFVCRARASQVGSPAPPASMPSNTKPLDTSSCKPLRVLCTPHRCSGLLSMHGVCDILGSCWRRSPGCLCVLVRCCC